MAVYNTKNITNLYWACNEGFKVGRDPMGIQNCSITLYGQLLPGMTNQTGHIRYYSFYCWLLSEYNNDRRGAKKYNVDQRNFIRRAELIMAFVMSGQNQNAVAGSLFVSQKRYNTDRKGHYLISEGADYEQNNKYWTYSTGAFGQYYLGQLIYLQLVTVKDNWFYTSSKGEDLAHAFCENIPEDVHKHYIDAICKGKLSEEDIKVLRPIGINQLKKGTSEWHYLNTLMIQPDINGSTLRRESIKLFLEAISTKCAINDFPKLQYEQYTANGLEAQFGWHYYYLCETIHYCIESIFWLILETAGENNYLAINRFIDIATKKILEANNNDISTYTIESVSPLITNYNIPIMQDELVDKTQTNQPAEAALKALLLLIKCYDTIIPQKEKFEAFEKRTHLSILLGNISQTLECYIGINRKLPIKKAIANIITTIMNQHTIVACRKMGNSTLDLRKFLIEDGCIFLVEIRKPQFTNPRIQTLYNFLTNLHYLRDGQLTETANNFIKNYE